MRTVRYFAEVHSKVRRWERHAYVTSIVRLLIILYVDFEMALYYYESDHGL